VTGATGFVGAVLTRQLVADGVDVRILHRPSSTFDLLGEAVQKVERVEGSLADARGLRRAMAEAERVYHVAGRVQFGGRGERAALRRVNVQGTANVVNAAIDVGVERLVHTSSIAALGPPSASDTTVDETHGWDDTEPRTAYARSKYDAELEVHRGIAEGLDAVIVNPSLVFGVGRAGEGTRRIVDAVRQGWARAVPPGGTAVVDVEDVVAGHRRAMRHGTCGRRYILSSENRSWEAIITTLARAFGQPPPRYTLPPALLTVAGSLAEGASRLLGQTPPLTRTLARQAARKRHYSNQRAVDELGCSFRPFEATARRIARDLAP
jgi:dihydroflavonol-4-reductase